MQGFNKIEVYFSLTHWLEGSESKWKALSQWKQEGKARTQTSLRGIQFFSSQQEPNHMAP